MKKILRAIGLISLIAISILVFVIFPHEPWYIYVPLLAIPTLYLIYRLLQVCNTTSILNGYEVLLIYFIFFLWLEIAQKLSYPFPGFIIFSQGLFGGFIIKFYLYKHGSAVKNRTPYVLGLILFAIFAYFGCYYLITGHKFFVPYDWRI